MARVLDFVRRIATQGDSACHIVLESGILDMLLGTYVIFPALSDAGWQDANSRAALRGACCSTLVVLGQSPQHQSIVFNHPVCILWTDCHPEFPLYPINVPIHDRSKTWRRVHSSYVKRREVIICKGSLWKPSNYATVDTEVRGDIAEFTK
jgi:hypothetical protein